jgi:hypothetical protein
MAADLARTTIRIIAMCVAPCVIAGAPGAAAAQSVSGVVHVTGTTLGASGATVVLLDSAGTVVRGALTREDGRFTLHAPHAGSYRIRARQIGFAADSSGVLQLSRDHVTTTELSLQQFVPLLERVEVVEKGRCTNTPAAGTLTLQLWQDVQSALTAAVITESDRAESQPAGAVLNRFSREIDPVTGRVMRSASWQAIGASSEPYSALPADSLAARGFVVRRGQDVVYYAPDARTLLSDAFARGHCFHPASDAEHPGLVGLAFAPVADSTVGQVSGVLWLDQANKQLRYLDFRYSDPNGASHTRGDADATDATGRIEYERLASGAWIVHRWMLRIPVVDVQMSSRLATGGSLRLGSTVSAMRTVRLASVWEIGGDAQITTDSSLLALNGGSVIQGSVLDSAGVGAADRPVKGVRVQLLPQVATSADDSATTKPIRQRETSAAGTFSFDSLPAGDYVLHIASTKLDTLGIDVPDRALHVDPAMKLTITTVLPTTATTIRALCGTELASGETVLHGIVRDSGTGKPVAGAAVLAHWFDLARPGRGVSVHEQSVTTLTGDDGRYALCAMPPSRPVYLRAAKDRRSSAVSRVESSTARIRMLDLKM